MAGPIAKESLFSRDSKAYRRQNRRNAYGLLQVAAMKPARAIRYDPSLTISEKATRMEAMARGFSEMRDGIGEVASCIGASAVYACIPGIWPACDAPMREVTRMRKAQLEALRCLTVLAEQDAVLADCLCGVYGTQDPAAWEAHRLLHSPHTATAAHRRDSDYVTMPEGYAAAKSS